MPVDTDVRSWLAANGPGGWIDDLRKRVHALECALTDALEFIKEQEGCDEGIPNKAMKVACVLREVLAKTGAT